MRKMKKFHEAVVSTYLNLSIGITSLICIPIFGMSWNFYADWEAWDWILSVLTGVFAITSQTARFKALKLQKAAKLQKMQPLTTVF